MKRLIYYLGAIIFTGSLLSGCYKDVRGPEIEYEPQAVSFSNDLVPLFKSKCTDVGCHVVGGHTPFLEDPQLSFKNIVGGNYVNIVFPKESILYKYVYGEMAQYSSKEDKQKIYDWIRNGARNN